MGNIAFTKLKSVGSEDNLFSLSGVEEDIIPESWTDLPEFIQKNKEAEVSVKVSFRNKEDLDKFADLMEMPTLKIPGKAMKSVWYPPLKNGERGCNCSFVWMDEADPAIKDLV